MHELISSQQSETVVLVASLLLLIGGALWGWKQCGTRGALLGVLGPLAWTLWQGHEWLTRFDARTGYFGLDKVNVLLLEVVVFVGLGAALGVLWNRISKQIKEN